MTKASGTRRARRAAGAKPRALIGRAGIVNTGALLPTKEVDIPEWGGAVLIRKLDAGARLDFQALLRSIADKPNRAELLALNLVRAMLINADGSRVFDDSEADLELLRRTQPDGFVRLLAECTAFANIERPLADAVKN